MPNAGGTTTTHVNLRRGPGTQHAVIRLLPPNTEVQVIHDVGDWLEIKTGNDKGFVHEKYVAVGTDAVAAGFLTQPDADPFAQVPLEPPATELIKLSSGARPAEKVVARTWNHCGNLLSVLAGKLKFSTAAAVAVFCVESGGKGFSDGKMLIRFENHHFYRYWGMTQSAVFAQHFRYDAAKRWLGHQWRQGANGPWRDVHVNQASEWAIFDFACTLDAHAAKLSISMGGPQIMGSNHADTGYESVEVMYDAFSRSESAQIVGFFDFLQGQGTHPPMVRALQKNDFIRFAELYNGAGNAAVYGARIEAHFTAGEKLLAKVRSAGAGG